MLTQSFTPVQMCDLSPLAFSRGTFTVVHVDAIRKKQKLYPPGFTNCHVYSNEKIARFGKFHILPAGNIWKIQIQTQNWKVQILAGKIWKILDLAAKFGKFKILPARFGKFQILPARFGKFNLLPERFGKFKILQLIRVNSPPLTHHY